MATTTLREGVEVYGSDGKKIGKVGHLFSAAAEPAADDATAGPSAEQAVVTGANADEAVEVSEMPATYNVTRVTASSGRFDSGGVPPVTGGTPERDAAAGVEGGGVVLGPSDTKYFEVHHGGLLGIGGESLYVPFSAVNVVDADGAVTLKCTADEAASLYTERPVALD
jgi:hypothetical protein